MKIRVPVKEEWISRDSEWKDVAAALVNLPSGMSLPVEFEEDKRLWSLTNFVYQKLNRGDVKYRCTRRGLTVYITKVNLNGGQ